MVVRRPHAPADAGLLRFGAFELDLHSRELREDGRTKGLPEQSIKVLHLLLQRAGELVLREEIRAELWPNDTVVEFDHSINTALRKLRVALGDTAESPRYIQTLARRGYRWIGPVVAFPEPVPAVTAAAPAARPAADSLAGGVLTGKRVSHYRVLEVLGGGGMGVVYKAEDLKLGRRVALKFLPDELAQNAVAMKRLEQEARAASALNHPNVCTIYEIADYEARPFIVMEFLDGETLRERIGAGGQRALTIEQQIDLGIQICDALAAAHSHGIIHRDIKPANVFVTRKGVAKILDFGVAKRSSSPVGADAGLDDRVDEAAEAHSAPAAPLADAELTRTGVTMGTASYMSPEQVRGDTLDSRTDLFSFGLVLYEMATGEAAFGAPTIALIRDAILHRDPQRPQELDPAIPPGLTRIIAKALAKPRDERYQRAEEIREDLRAQLAGLREANTPILSGAGAAPARAGRWLSLPQRFWPRQRRLTLVAVICLAVAALGVVFLFLQHRPITLASSDQLLVAEFINTTGEPVFDDTLRQAALVKLGESPYFTLVPETKISQTLKAMNHPSGERILPPLSRELCQRTGATVLVGGSVVPIGNRYDLTLQATRCGTGATLAQATAPALDVQQVLTALGRALNTLRRDLGEPAGSLRRFDTPIEQATSTSLAALKAFTTGQERRARGEEAESRTDYRLAIELDGSFAMAYAQLAAVSRSLAEIDTANAYLRQAFDLRGHLTEREKLYIQARFYSDSARDVASEIETYSLWTQLYPRDASAYNGLASAYIEIGQAQKAIRPGLQAVALDPGHALHYASLARAYERASRFEDAKAVCNRAIANQVDSALVHAVLFRVGFVEGDGPAMQRALDWASGKPHESTMIYYRAKSLLSLGRVRQAQQLFERARQLAESNGLKEQAVAVLNGQAQFSAEMGLTLETRAAAESVLRSVPSPGRHEVYAVLALARSGDAARAQTLLAEINAHPMPGFGMNDVVLPAVRAAIALDRGQASQAIEELQRSAAYGLGQDSGGMTLYYRGLALLQLGSGNEAAAEFTTIADNRGVVAVDVYWPLAHLGLARAYAMSGDRARSLDEYRQLLTFWKDADPDFALMRQARSEYRTLTGHDFQPADGSTPGPATGARS